MRHFLVLILMLVCLRAATLPAQQVTDSLYLSWTNTALPDTQRLEAMKVLIIQRYLYRNPDSTRLLVKEMYQFAEQRRMKRYMGLALVLESVVFQQRGPYDEGYKLAERSVKLYQEVGFEKGVSQAYTSMAILKEKMGDMRGALSIYQKTLDISLRTKDKRNEALALNNVGSAHQRLGDVKEAESYYERGLALAREMQDPLSMNLAYMNLGFLYQNNGEYGLSLSYFTLADKGFEAVGNLQRQAEIAYNMGLVYEKTGNYDSALVAVNKGLQRARELKNTELEAALLNLLGGINQRKGDYQEAIVLLTQCLRMYDSIGNKGGAAATFGNIGNIYRDQKDFEQANLFYERSRALNDSIGNKRGVAMSHSSLGDILADQGKYEEAMAEYERSLKLAIEVEAQQEIAYARQAIGRLFIKKNDLEKAESNCNLSLEINEAIGNQIGMAGDLNCLTSVALNRKDYPLAIRYGERALQLARAVGITTEVQQVSFMLYQAYKATGKQGPALDMYELYIQYRDSTENVENTRTILKERFQYEQDKKDALAQKEISLRNLQRNASLGGLGLVAILAGVLFVNGRRRRKTNELLSAQKSEIQAKSNQNELLLKEIHHRVKNNLQTISSLLHLQSAHIKDADVKQAVAAGQHRVESMALIHQKLYQRDNLAAIEMKDYLSNLVTSLIETFDADPDRITFHLDMPELELDVDTAVPLGLIVNELITNSLKYAFPDGRAGTITVSLQKTGDQLDLLVADNGVGSANT
ncbi:MAG: hypothetical protein EAZ89_08640, partial [Bacteroidetes bacterium]